MTNEEIIKKVFDFIKSISTPLVYIFIGIGANYIDHYRKGTLTKKQAIVSGAMGVIVGYMSWSLCMNFGWSSHAGYIVPVATMGGERIVPFLIEKGPDFIKKIFEKKTGEKIDENNG